MTKNEVDALIVDALVELNELIQDLEKDIDEKCPISEQTKRKVKMIQRTPDEIYQFCHNRYYMHNGQPYDIYQQMHKDDIDDLINMDSEEMMSFLGIERS